VVVLLVRMMLHVIAVPSLLAGEPFALQQSFVIPESDSQAGAKHGSSVAIDGDIAVVGAPYHTALPFHSGEVRVYDIRTGALKHKLTSAGAQPLDHFGLAVSVSGKRVVVGAPFDDTGAPAAGRVYVYDLSSATPESPLQTLNNPAPGTNDYFGYCVAISGDWLIVGAPYDDDGTVYGGSAYVYNLASGVPSSPSITLRNPTGYLGSEFGISVAVFGNRAVVGEAKDYADGLIPGRAFVYDLAAGS